MRRVNGIGTTIYGGAKPEELTGGARFDAEQRGYSPHSYQVVKWFTVFFLPVVPLGTYRVLKLKQKFFAMELPQYSMTKVDWDWAQVGRHYLAAYGLLAVFVWVVFSIF